MKPSAQSGYAPASRISLPEPEKNYPWLTPLLDAYFVIDQGVQEAIKRRERQGHTLACARGCSSCCRSHTDIPVYPLELMGISMYILEVLPRESQQQLKEHIETQTADAGCPFLIAEHCSIHPVRPIACRQFNVFQKSCAPGEDAFHTRRKDVLTPISTYQDRAFEIMLPFYGFKKKHERKKAIKNGTLHRYAKVLKSLQWEKIIARIQPLEK